jgi:hypothetical protein
LLAIASANAERSKYFEQDLPALADVKQILEKKEY